jgi:hypothetical protein
LKQQGHVTLKNSLDKFNIFNIGYTAVKPKREHMKFFSLQPFIPSGEDFDKSKRLFEELGFDKKWEVPGYAGFGRDECNFILQKYNNAEFAQNLMLTVRVDNVEEFREHIVGKRLEEKFGIKLGNITQQPYGREVNIIDVAGVCWHFVQE